LPTSEALKLADLLKRLPEWDLDEADRLRLSLARRQDGIDLFARALAFRAYRRQWDDQGNFCSEDAVLAARCADHRPLGGLLGRGAAARRQPAEPAVEVDGHDHQELVDQLSADRADDAPPLVLVARTTFGCGVSFMEREIKWHYLPMTAEQYQMAVEEASRL